MKTFKALILTVALLMPTASVADCCCRKIVDYKSASSDSEVKELIKKGYQPFGGIAIHKFGTRVQAMVKYEEVIE